MLPNDVKLAKRYLDKSKNAQKRKLEFTLTFSDYKRLSKIKRCQYSGIVLVDEFSEDPGIAWRRRSLERVDNTKGYTRENTIVICQGINQFKSTWEDPTNPLDLKMVTKIVSNINKRLK